MRYYAICGTSSRGVIVFSDVRREVVQRFLRLWLQFHRRDRSAHGYLVRSSLKVKGCLDCSALVELVQLDASPLP